VLGEFGAKPLDFDNRPIEVSHQPVTVGLEVVCQRPANLCQISHCFSPEGTQSRHCADPPTFFVSVKTHVFPPANQPPRHSHEPRALMHSTCISWPVGIFAVHCAMLTPTAAHAPAIAATCTAFDIASAVLMGGLPY
jgi:hypothetical protein